MKPSDKFDTAKAKKVTDWLKLKGAKAAEITSLVTSGATGAEATEKLRAWLKVRGKGKAKAAK